MESGSKKLWTALALNLSKFTPLYILDYIPSKDLGRRASNRANARSSRAQSNRSHCACAREGRTARACAVCLIGCQPSNTMGNCCRCLQRERGEERTPIAQPNIAEATGRLENQKKSLEGDIEKLRQELEENRQVTSSQMNNKVGVVAMNVFCMCISSHAEKPEPQE